MSDAAQAVARAVAAMDAGQDPAGGTDDMAKKKNGKARKPRAPKADRPRDATAGLKKNPKSKALFLNTDASREVVLKALRLALKDGETYGDAATVEARRLVARLEARQ